MGKADRMKTETEIVKEHGKLILVRYHQSAKGLSNINANLWNYKAIDVVNG